MSCGSDFRMWANAYDHWDLSEDGMVIRVTTIIPNLKGEHDMDYNEQLKKYTINLYDLLGALIEYGQRDKQFKLGDIIKYDPVSVVEIARDFLDKKTEWNPDCENCNPEDPGECQLCKER